MRGRGGGLRGGGMERGGCEWEGVEEGESFRVAVLESRELVYI